MMLKVTIQIFATRNTYDEDVYILYDFYLYDKIMSKKYVGLMVRNSWVDVLCHTRKKNFSDFFVSNNGKNRKFD